MSSAGPVSTMRPRYITAIAVGDVLHDREIVRDEDVGEAEPRLQLLQEVEDLRPDRHVERRHRLVADDELRLDRKRPGDADALALPAGELVRVAPGVERLEPDHLEELGDALLALGRRHHVVQHQRLGENLADGHARVERRERVLEDQLHLAAQGAEGGLAQGGDIVAVEDDAAGGRLDQPHHEPPDRRLAAAGLADERQRLAGAEHEGHAVDRLHGRKRPPERRALRDEVLHEIVDGEHVLAHRPPAAQA